MKKKTRKKSSRRRPRAAAPRVVVATVSNPSRRRRRRAAPKRSNPSRRRHHARRRRNPESWFSLMNVAKAFAAGAGAIYVASELAQLDALAPLYKTQQRGALTNLALAAGGGFGLAKLTGDHAVSIGAAAGLGGMALYLGAQAMVQESEQQQQPAALPQSLSFDPAGAFETGAIFDDGSTGAVFDTTGGLLDDDTDDALVSAGLY